MNGYAKSFAPKYPEAEYVTFFDKSRGVGFHYYPSVPNYPASHGCVRVAVKSVAKQIYYNTKPGVTVVTVTGTWNSPSTNPKKL